MADSKKFDVYFGKRRPDSYGYGEFYVGSVDDADQLMVLVRQKGKKARAGDEIFVCPHGEPIKCMAYESFGHVVAVPGDRSLKTVDVNLRAYLDGWGTFSNPDVRGLLKRR